MHEMNFRCRNPRCGTVVRASIVGPTRGRCYITPLNIRGNARGRLSAKRRTPVSDDKVGRIQLQLLSHDQSDNT